MRGTTTTQRGALSTLLAMALLTGVVAVITTRFHGPGPNALVDAVTAENELLSFGLDAWAERAGALAVELGIEGHGDPIAHLRDNRS